MKAEAAEALSASNKEIGSILNLAAAGPAVDVEDCGASFIFKAAAVSVFDAVDDDAVSP